MRVLITDSDNRSALAATRSLGKQGHFILTAGESKASLAAVSRYSSAFARYPSPSHNPDAFIPAVAEMARAHSIDVILPMTDITTLLLTQNQAALPPTCRLPFPSPETVTLAANKAHVMQLAERVGVPIPKTLYLEAPERLAEIEHAIAYPIVLKPARSRIRTPNGFVSTGVSYAHDAAELEQRIRALRPEEFPLLLQERIVGPGVGLFACYDGGRAIARFAHKRIREKPPSGGVSVLRESAPLDPDAVEYAHRLLSALEWRGVAMVEFKRDRRDGSLRLMEINGRFWGSLQLAIDAGVDFPALLVAIAAGEPPTRAGNYRLGVRSRWFWGDVDVLLMLLLRSRRSLSLPVDHPGRWRSLWDFLFTGGAEQREEILRRDDPRPWYLETRRWILGR
jgi:predicted ATP-grasp superfamily ATP-dependent carboligase